MLTIPADIIGESYLKHIMAVGVITPTVIYSTVYNVVLIALDYYVVYVGKCSAMCV